MLITRAWKQTCRAAQFASLAVVVAAGGVGCTSDSGRASNGEAGTAKADADSAFCAVIGKHKKRFEQTMAGADTTNGLLNILVGVSAIGDLQMMWDDVARTAPEDIRPDAEAIRDAWKSQQDSAVSQDWAALIATAMLHGGAASRINERIASQCGANLAPAGAGFNALDPDIPVKPILLKADFSDDTDYNFGITLNAPYKFDTMPNIADAPPGKALIQLAATGQGSILNETPQRNSPVPTNMQVAMLWRDGSRACALLNQQDNADIEGYCGRSFTITAPVTELSPGASAEFVWSIPTFYPIVVEESEAESAATEFAKPHDWAFKLQDGGLASLPTLCIAVRTAC